MTSEAQKRASRKYDANNTKQILLKLNLKTDADILDHLDKVESKMGYIKELIRKDILSGHAPEATEKRILEGNFKNGEYVTVMINGAKYRRKVKYSDKWNDLIIQADGKEHPLYEFN